MPLIKLTLSIWTQDIPKKAEFAVLLVDDDVQLSLKIVLV